MKPFRRWPAPMRNAMSWVVIFLFLVALLRCGMEPGFFGCSLNH